MNKSEQENTEKSKTRKKKKLKKVSKAQRMCFTGGFKHVKCWWGPNGEEATVPKLRCNYSKRLICALVCFSECMHVQIYVKIKLSSTNRTQHQQTEQMSVSIIYWAVIYLEELQLLPWKHMCAHKHTLCGDGVLKLIFLHSWTKSHLMWRLQFPGSMHMHVHTHAHARTHTHSEVLMGSLCSCVEMMSWQT